MISWLDPLSRIPFSGPVTCDSAAPSGLDLGRAAVPPLEIVIVIVIVLLLIIILTIIVLMITIPITITIAIDTPETVAARAGGEIREGGPEEVRGGMFDDSDKGGQIKLLVPSIRQLLMAHHRWTMAFHSA